MRRARPLTIAVALSVAIHLGALLAPERSAVDMPTDAPRLAARLSPAAAQVQTNADKAGAVTKPRPKRRKPAPSEPPSPNAAQAQLPPDATDSAPVEGPTVAQSETPAAPPLAANSEPATDQSGAGEQAQASVIPAAQRLPRQGRVMYTGTAGGFMALSASGQASWEHDGVHFKSQLSAGLSSPDSALDYRSEGHFDGATIVCDTTEDNRRGKISTSRISLADGKVYMQRGQDSRERTIKGLAVAVSALPQLLMTLDESVDKAAFFVVGDFWVDDSVLALQGKERLRLPAGEVDTRHYATRANNGTLIEVWLAPDWQNAPARIRIETKGIVVDLKASEVSIDGHSLALAPDVPR